MRRKKVNCLFLYHPKSGKGKVAKKIGYIRKRLAERFDRVDIIATESGDDMTRYARDGAEKYDVILFSGGDGTFNRVLQGVEEGRDVRLGYIPGGTTNDVARSARYSPQRAGRAERHFRGLRAASGRHAVERRTVCHVYCGGGSIYAGNVYGKTCQQEAFRHSRLCL